MNLKIRIMKKINKTLTTLSVVAMLFIFVLNSFSPCGGGVVCPRWTIFIYLFLFFVRLQLFATLRFYRFLIWGNILTSFLIVLIYGASFFNLTIMFISIIIAIYDFYNQDEFSKTIKNLLK